MDILGLIPSLGTVIWDVVAFVIALSIIVAVHEYGHYIVGRWSGIHADVFSIGFGPVLASRVDRRGTKWQIAALPFGGYVKFKGDADAASATVDGDAIRALSPEERRQTMHGAPLWARSITVFAGPAFNFVLSVVIFGALLMYRGVASDPLTIGEIRSFDPSVTEEVGLEVGDVILAIGGEPTPSLDQFDDYIETIPRERLLDYRVRREGDEITVPGPYPYPSHVLGLSFEGAAQDAGLETGDVIYEVDGQEIFAFSQLRDAVAESEGAPLNLTIYRSGETSAVTLTPRRTDIVGDNGGFETRYLIGISGGLFFVPAPELPSLTETLQYGVDQVFFVITSSVSALYHMATGAISTCNLSGPIGIAEVSGEAASRGLLTFLGTVALISTAVGFLNLLPIPVLDGGHLVFHAFEAVTGRPPSDRALNVMMTVGLGLMLGLMVFAVSNDLFCP
ncbi:MAG: RIP metalloprotease RseP [Pseudomonadota bacterium]